MSREVYSPDVKMSEADRLWFAFRYIADELSDSEMELFEDALLEDERLQKSVIEATRLLSTLKMSCDEWHFTKYNPSPALHQNSRYSIRSNTSSSIVAMGIALAALTLGFVFVSRFENNHFQSPTVAQQSSPASTKAGHVKNDAADPDSVSSDDLRSAEQLLTLYAVESAFQEPSSIWPGDSPDQEIEDELNVPTWLLAAIQLDAAADMPHRDIDADDKREVF
ncbi:MAG: hypothetical protein R3C20_13050 [Planctomycetaceae bacterium]